ncbi:MAG: flagellar basal body rod protein FlgB [Vampirovibrionales bacterium]
MTSVQGFSSQPFASNAWQAPAGASVFASPAMAGNTFGNLSTLSQYLGALGEKQQLTSNNIVNAHTPNYTRKHASFQQVLAARVNHSETSFSEAMGSAKSPMWRYDTGEKVNLQDEFLELQRTLMSYNIVTRRLSSVITNLKTAAQTGR